MNSIVKTIKNSIPVTNFLKKAKRNSLFICPECGSGTGPHKTGALQVYRDTNQFYCHKRGFRGDVIELYEKIKGVNFKTASGAVMFSCMAL